MFSRSAESEARACCKEENGEAGLREGTGEITCIKVRLKRGKPASCYLYAKSILRVRFL